MNITVEDLGQTRKTVIVTVAAHEIEEEQQNILQKYSKQAKVKGFRPGKAPLSLILKDYSKELKEDLERQIIRKGYEFLLEQPSLNIYKVVNVEAGEVTPGTKAALNFSIDLQPTFDLPEYRAIAVQLPKVKVTQEELDKAVEKIRSQNAEFQMIEEAAQKSDYVKLAYEGKIDGTPIAELIPGQPMFGKQSSTWEEAGVEDGGVPAVVEGVIGMKAGEDKEVSMTFPDDFRIQELAGKKATYSLSVKEVRRKILPEMNEAFFKDMEVEDLAGLHAKIQKEFEQRRAFDNANKAREQIMDHLNAAVSFPVPESAIEESSDRVLRSHMTRLINQGVPAHIFGKNREKLLDEARQIGAEQAKTIFIFEAIAKAENITLENEDLNRMIYSEALALGVKPNELVKELKADHQRVVEFRSQCLVNKVLDFLHKEARIEFKDEVSK